MSTKFVDQAKSHQKFGYEIKGKKLVSNMNFHQINMRIDARDKKMAKKSKNEQILYLSNRLAKEIQVIESNDLFFKTRRELDIIGERFGVDTKLFEKTDTGKKSLVYAIAIKATSDEF
jgi:hypothetical protein